MRFSVLKIRIHNCFAKSLERTETRLIFILDFILPRAIKRKKEPLKKQFMRAYKEENSTVLTKMRRFVEK